MRPPALFLLLWRGASACCQRLCSLLAGVWSEESCPDAGVKDAASAAADKAAPAADDFFNGILSPGESRD